ncbi:MAG: SDR family NAD(P)-dependent oxidoreductase [Planctomycetes bacterium]|nr:SDR family NAD(P)-dependent oxidoreductase [Planctomycetota bacterium]
MENRRAFWREKVVLITGASSGLGLALARHCHAAGARVGLIARRVELLQAHCEELSRQGGRCAWHAADVRSREELERAVAALELALGPCEVMIANAGIYRRTNATCWATAAAEDVFAVNLAGVVNAIGCVLPGMVERDRGNIVAISSLLAFSGYPGAAAYSASKMAVLRLLDGLRIDLRKSGIRVTTVCPGYVDTPMITDRERAELRSLVSAPIAAKKIAAAIEAGRPMLVFPRSMYWLLRLAGLLPYRLLDTILGRQPELEETQTSRERPSTGIEEHGD